MMDDAYSTAAISSSLLATILPSQEAAKQRKEILEKATEEEASEWIFCDVCRKWYHAL